MGHRPARREVISCLAALALASAFVGCADDSVGPALGPPVVPTIAPVQSGTVTVSARDNDFVDKEIAVAVGTEVVWKNDGRNEHNISPADAGTDFKVDTAKFAPKAEYRYTFTKPGTYHYFCTIHGTTTKGMIGTVQVVAPQDGGKL